MRRIVFIAGMILTIAAAPAHAVCRLPSIPTGEPVEPVAPLCVNLAKQTHTCTESVIGRYYDDVNEYNAAADRYVKKLHAYVDDALEYANCKIDGLR